MALFREKCARCGEARSQGTYEGLPTCEACEQLIEAKLAAAAEDPRACPIDGTPMTKEIHLNIVIDRCPSCRGVWLDGGELELMKGTLEAGMTTDLLRGMTYPF